MWIVIIIIVGVIVFASIKGNKSSNGSIEDASLLFSYFEMIRNSYYGGEQNCSILIGSPTVEYNGTVMLSGHLAAFVSKDNNLETAKAQALGMETRAVDGKYEHLFIVKKKFSKQTKKQVLQAIGNKIIQSYPNDLIKYDDSIPLLMIVTDIKDFIEAVERASSSNK